MKSDFKLLGLFLALGLVACQSSPAPAQLSEEEVIKGLEKPFQDLLSAGRHEELIARLEQFKFKYPADSARFQDLYAQAIVGLEKERADLLIKREYRLALDKGESLEALGVAVNPNQTEVLSVYLNEVKQKAEGQARAIAYHYRSKGYRVPPEYLIHSEGAISSGNNSATWLKGTLTLIVDQGVRMQSGVGVPAKMLGSAFLIDPAGYALTNYHVISSEVDLKYKGFSRLYARLPGGRGERLKADVIGYNQDLDMALVKVHFPVEYYFNLWNDGDDAMRIGQSVYALGSPLGLEQTITSGILSAHNRVLLPIGDAFQLDAAVNQGNSGGPVVNASGDILGMVFAGIPQYQGLNFAISADWLRLFLPFLYEAGSAYNGWLGIAISENFQGLEVIHTVRGEAGEGLLKAGDKLLSLNGRPLESIADYQRAVLTSRSLMRLQWQRGDEIDSALVLPKERPEEPLDLVFKRSPQEDFLSLVLGATLESGKRTMFYRQYRVARVFPNLMGDELGLNNSDQIDVYNVKMDKNKEYFELGFLIRRQVAGFMESPLGIRLPLTYPYFI